MHKLDHSLLSFGREVALDVYFTESFTKDVLHDIDATSPAWVHLLAAAELLAEEVKVSLDEVITQRVGSTTDGTSREEVS